MQIEICLKITTDDGIIQDNEIITLCKPHDQLDRLGLSIIEAKTIMAKLQETIVTLQAESFSAERSICLCCNRKLRKKGFAKTRFRTVFGNISITSPRFYYCSCVQSNVLTFSPLSECKRQCKTSPQRR